MGWYVYDGLSGYTNNFLGVQVPVYLLIFSVLVIVLAKLLNSAVAAIPVAVIVTAATGAYLALFVRNLSFFFVNDVAALAGFILVAFVVLKMFLKV